MADVALLKLQYEFLNTPIQELAANEGVPISIIETEIRNGQWVRRVPITVTPLSDNATDEEIAIYQEQFLDINQKRLKLYNLAKEILLAHRYLTLESAILTKAADLVDQANITQKDLKYLSALYKDLASGTSLGNISAIQIGEDANGLPTAIIRDLSGGK